MLAAISTLTSCVNFSMSTVNVWADTVGTLSAGDNRCSHVVMLHRSLLLWPDYTG